MQTNNESYLIDRCAPNSIPQSDRNVAKHEIMVLLTLALSIVTQPTYNLHQLRGNHIPSEWLTFLSIWTRSMMWSIAWARWSPVWLLGRRWKVISDDRRRSAALVPSVYSSIQCAVTAMKPLRLGLLQQSMVRETFPTAFWIKNETLQKKKSELEIDRPLNLQPWNLPVPPKF